MPWSSSNRKARLPADWETRRRKVRARAQDQCEWTDELGRCTAEGTDCDHIEAGDDHSLSNLQWLCSFHHSLKTRRESAAANRRRLTARRAPEAHPGIVKRPPGGRKIS